MSTSPEGALLGTTSPPVVSFFLEAVVAGTAASFGATVSCEVTSRPGTIGALPRYAASTSASIGVRALGVALPLVAGVVAERGAVNVLGEPISTGLFFGVAGAGAGSMWTIGAVNVTVGASEAACLGLLSPSVIGDVYSDPRASWSSQLLPACPAAVAAVEAVREGALATGGPASMTLSLTTATHLLLFAPRDGPYFSGSNFAVSLGGVPCLVNWVSPSGKVASVTTPALSTLCALAGRPSSGDCGPAILVVSGAGAWSAVASAAVYAASAGPDARLAVNQSVVYAPAPLFPHLVRNDWPSILSASSSLSVQSPLASLLSFAAADSATLAGEAILLDPGAGARVYSACADGGTVFSPADACAAAFIGGPLSAAASVATTAISACAYGAGYACMLCPAAASCPGGAVILPRPGAWIARPNSPPAHLETCPAPSALLRCPGALSAPASTFSCGTGYAGPACAGCAADWFATIAVDCKSCSLARWSSARGVEGQIIALLIFAAGVCALVAVLSFAARSAAPTLGFGFATKAGMRILVWLWRAGQPLGASARLLAAVVSPAAAAALVALTAVQGVGIALDSACVDLNARFFSSAWAASGGIFFAVILIVFALAHPPRDHSVPSPRPVKNWSVYLLLVTGAALTASQGPAISSLTSALACRLPSPVATSMYLTGIRGSDGSALRSALSDPGSDIAAALASAGVPVVLEKDATYAMLVRGARDPVYAAQSGVETALAARLRISLLAADSSLVCFEGAHWAVLPVASIALALVAAILPIAALFGDRCCALRAPLWRVRLAAALRMPGARASGDVLGAAELAANAVLTMCATLAPLARPRFGALFIGACSFVAVATLAIATGAARLQPARPSQIWSDGARTYLNVTASLIAAVAALIAGVSADASQGADSAAGIFLLVTAAVVVVAARAWLRSLSRVARVKATARREADALEANAANASVVHKENPLNISSAPQSELAQGRVKSPDVSPRAHRETSAGAADLEAATAGAAARRLNPSRALELANAATRARKDARAALNETMPATTSSRVLRLRAALVGGAMAKPRLADPLETPGAYRGSGVEHVLASHAIDESVRRRLAQPQPIPTLSPLVASLESSDRVHMFISAARGARDSPLGSKTSSVGGTYADCTHVFTPTRAGGAIVGEVDEAAFATATTAASVSPPSADGVSYVIPAKRNAAPYFWSWREQRGWFDDTSGLVNPEAGASESSPPPPPGADALSTHFNASQQAVPESETLAASLYDEQLTELTPPSYPVPTQDDEGINPATHHSHSRPVPQGACAIPAISSSPVRPELKTMWGPAAAASAALRSAEVVSPIALAVAAVPSHSKDSPREKEASLPDARHSVIRRKDDTPLSSNAHAPFKSLVTGDSLRVVNALAAAARLAAAADAAQPAVLRFSAKTPFEREQTGLTKHSNTTPKEIGSPST